MKNSPQAKSETPQIGKNPKRRERKKNAQGRSFSIDVPFYRGRVRKRGRIKKVKREEEKKKKKEERRDETFSLCRGHKSYLPVSPLYPSEKASPTSREVEDFALEILPNGDPIWRKEYGGK